MLGALMAGSAILGGVGGMVSGNQQAKAMKNANRDAALHANQAVDLLGPQAIRGMLYGDPNEPGMAGGLYGMMAPTMNTLASQNALAAGSAARGVSAGLARAGLGSTGLGAALGGGMRAGATYQTNALRARMMQDLLNSAIGIRQQQGGYLTGIQTMPVMASGTTGALQGLGVGLQGAQMHYDKYGTTTNTTEPRT